MAHTLRFDEHIRTAERLAQQMTGVKAPMDYVWLTTITVDAAEDTEDPMCLSALEEPDPQGAVIEDLLEELEDQDDIHASEANSPREPFDGQDSELVTEPKPFDGWDKDPGNDSIAMDPVGPVAVVKPLQQDPKDSDSDIEILGDTTMLGTVIATKNAEDSDSDVEIIGDITMQETARVKANFEIHVKWIEPIVGRSMPIALDNTN